MKMQDLSGVGVSSLAVALLRHQEAMGSFLLRYLYRGSKFIALQGNILLFFNITDVFWINRPDVPDYKKGIVCFKDFWINRPISSIQIILWNDSLNWLLADKTDRQQPV